MNDKQKNALKGDFSVDCKSTEMMFSTMSEWYDAKHRLPSDEEVRFVNSLRPASCPRCGSRGIIRKGMPSGSGIQRWKCRECGSRFGPLAGTIFDSRKIPVSEWVEFLIHLFEHHSVRTAASDNRNAGTTGRYWLNKVFLVLKDYQKDVILSGRVHIDETFVAVWKGSAEGRGGKKLRGLSRNQCCIASGTDGGRCFLILMGSGKPNAAKAAESYSPHMSDGCFIVHDGERSHDAFIASRSFGSETHRTEETKGIPDKENPMEPINKVHRYLKGFLRSHAGYSREDLQDWLNLFCFMWNEKGSYARKAQIFIEMAVVKRGTLRYRKWKEGT